MSESTKKRDRDQDWRITAVDRDGRITVESPRGPVTVWLPETARYGVGETVEVRTALHPTG